jgi:hypothetical protein
MQQSPTTHTFDIVFLTQNEEMTARLVGYTQPHSFANSFVLRTATETITPDITRDERINSLLTNLLAQLELAESYMTMINIDPVVQEV